MFNSVNLVCQRFSSLALRATGTPLVGLWLKQINHAWDDHSTDSFLFIYCMYNSYGEDII